MKIKFNIQFFAEGAAEGENVEKEPTAVEKNYLEVIKKMKENAKISKSRSIKSKKKENFETHPWLLRLP